MSDHSPLEARRQSLEFLSASPYCATVGGVAAFLRHDGIAQDIRSGSFASIMRDRMRVYENPKDALTIFEWEVLARTKAHQGHWVFMASGTDDDATLFANRDGFWQIQLRPRRVRDAK